MKTVRISNRNWSRINKIRRYLELSNNNQVIEVLFKELEEKYKGL